MTTTTRQELSMPRYAMRERLEGWRIALSAVQPTTAETVLFQMADELLTTLDQVLEDSAVIAGAAMYAFREMDDCRHDGWCDHRYRVKDSLYAALYSQHGERVRAKLVERLTDFKPEAPRVIQECAEQEVPRNSVSFHEGAQKYVALAETSLADHRYFEASRFYRTAADLEMMAEEAAPEKRYRTKGILLRSAESLRELAGLCDVAVSGCADPGAGGCIGEKCPRCAAREKLQGRAQ